MNTNHTRMKLLRQKGNYDHLMTAILHRMSTLEEKVELLKQRTFGDEADHDSADTLYTEIAYIKLLLNERDAA